MADLRKGSRVTGAERDQQATDLKKRYDGGASIRSLAESTGRSYGFIHRILSDSGTAMQPWRAYSAGRDEVEVKAMSA